MANAQNVLSVYNRDTHEGFHLKTVHVENTVVGPLVKTSTILTYENPYKTMTEATLNFTLPDFAALGGFAYFYGNEYVRGTLMDKNKAWFIYTAITSRGRDPGIMEQWSPTDYHCQIFPIKQGSDLRIKLWTIGTLTPVDGRLVVPQPTAPRKVGYDQTDPTLVTPNIHVRAVQTGRVTHQNDQFEVRLLAPVTAVAQKFKDGRIYVAGLARAVPDAPQTPGLDASRIPIVIEKAFYEPLNTQHGGADVTDKVAKLIKNRQYAVDANNHTFGDPNPGIFKQLRVNFRHYGKEKEVIVRENDRIDFLAESDSRAGYGHAPRISELKQPQFVNLDTQTVAFTGWIPRVRTLSLRYHGKDYRFKPQVIDSGSDTARLWAQQMLATNHFAKRSEVLKFSMKYGVPSTATALLAVPAAEMRLYREKERAYEKQQAEQRRQTLERERQHRNWEGRRNQNWNASGGGDPEIRIQLPCAKLAEAVLPDGRVVTLTKTGDFWGGNFEIPADALEGAYTVKVLSHYQDGSTREQSWNYEVKLTPPSGTAHLFLENGHFMIEVRANRNLSEVTVYDSNGSHWVLHEEKPGTYRGQIPLSEIGTLTVLLKDRAGNKGEIHCSLSR